MDPELNQLQTEIDRLKKRVILLEDSVIKLRRLIEPTKIQRIRAVEEGR
jgi:hypothetical protein